MPATSYIASIAAFAVFAYVGFTLLRKIFRVTTFVTSSRLEPSHSSPGERGFRLSTPLGGVDLQGFEGDDAGLDSIPKYPGAVPVDPKPGYQMQMNVMGRRGQFIEQTFWTADPFDVVVGYYQREFPAWKEDTGFMLGESGGFRCHQQNPGSIRRIEIRSDSVAMSNVRKFPEARTLVKYSVLYGDRLPTLP